MGERYDPFARGPCPAGVRTIQAPDTARDRIFPCEIWYPAAARHSGQDLSPATQDAFTVTAGGAPRRQMAVRNATPRDGTCPLIVFSHSSGQHRRMATYLCTHLASHGYVVAALDHSEVVDPSLARREGETDDQRTARAEAWIASRVPDIRFLLDHLLGGPVADAGADIDPSRIGIVGHSCGGWTALAAVAAERRIGTVVALAPGGSSRPRPGVLRASLTFAWGREVPALYLVAENDTPLPLAGMFELFERTPAPRRMVILRRADHLHFMDDVERQHEAVRATPFTGDLAWLPREMRPIAELCSGDQAHLFVRGLTLCHLDAILKRHEPARGLLAGDLEAALAARGVEARLHRP